MIANIEGWLEGVVEDTARVRVGSGRAEGVEGASNDLGGMDVRGLSQGTVPGAGGYMGAMIYEVLLPAYSAARLRAQAGGHIVLHTLYFIESHNQGSSMMPRLAGFMSDLDRRFFELFTTCKGIGYRKALRAMTVPVGQIAGAIADRDSAVLQSLPEVGRRTAETIIATLNGKVDAYLEDEVGVVSATGAKGDVGGEVGGGGGPQITIAREALDVLTRLGENRAAASGWVNEALQMHEGPVEDVQELLGTVFRIKGRGG